MYLFPLLKQNELLDEPDGCSPQRVFGAFDDELGQEILLQLFIAAQ